MKKRKEFVEKGHNDVSSASSRRLCLRTLLNWLFGLFVVFLEDFGRHHEIVDAVLFEHEGGGVFPVAKISADDGRIGVFGQIGRHGGCNLEPINLLALAAEEVETDAPPVSYPSLEGCAKGNGGHTRFLLNAMAQDFNGATLAVTPFVVMATKFIANKVNAARVDPGVGLVSADLDFCIGIKGLEGFPETL